MTKTVAEVIWGITSRPCYNRRNEAGERKESCERINCTEWVAHDPSARNTSRTRVEYALEDFGEPTVDDIRSWLQGQDVSVWAGENMDTPLLLNGDWVFLDVIQNNLDHPNCTHIKSETMLGALEAVVRSL